MNKQEILEKSIESLECTKEYLNTNIIVLGNLLKNNFVLSTPNKNYISNYIDIKSTLELLHISIKSCQKEIKMYIEELDNEYLREKK